MKSTLYIKFIIVYIIFGFLSIFTIATLTAGLISSPLTKAVSTELYKEAALMASDYLPGYFSEQLTLNNVRTQLTGMETHLNAAVWFVDKDGNIITYAQSENFPSPPVVLEEFNPAETGSSKYLIGDYHEYFEEDVITVISPVMKDYLPQEIGRAHV